jgi:serine/threonine protein phosphatase PrpC
VETIEVEETVYQYFAVFDGHGGHLASNYLSHHLHALVREYLLEGQEPKCALTNALATVEDRFKKNSRLAHKSGSCAVVCLISDKDCWVANVGDCRMLSFSRTSSVSQITRDHKP